MVSWRTLLVLVFLLPLAPPVVLLLYLYRLILSRVIVPVFRPDLRRILPESSATLANDPFLLKPRCNIVFGAFFGEELRPPRLREAVRKGLVDSGKYPELGERVENFGGHFFWKRCKGFRIEEHVFVEEDEELEDLDGLLSRLVTQPWEEGKPLWEFRHFNRLGIRGGKGWGEKGNSLIILRMHHSMADGFSITYFMGDFLSALWPEAKLDIPQLQSFSGGRRGRGGIMCLLSLPWKILQEFTWMYGRIRGPHPLKSSLPAWASKGESENEKFLVRLSPALPLAAVKRRREEWKVSFSTVLISAFTTALRGRVKGEESLPVSITIPLGNHPNTLRNHLTLGLLNLPLQLESREERIRACQLEYERQLDSSIPRLFRFLIPFGGILPSPLLTHFFLRWGKTVPVGISLFPGPQVNSHFLQDIFFTNGLLPGECGLGLAVISFKKQIRIALCADASVLSGSELDGILGEMGSELELGLKSE